MEPRCSLCDMKMRPDDELLQKQALVKGCRNCDYGRKGWSDETVTEQADHHTVAVQVWADVDAGIADTVRYLNTIPSVRTKASCQGTSTYAPYVMVTWETEEARRVLEAEFVFELLDDQYQTAYVHPK